MGGMSLCVVESILGKRMLAACRQEAEGYNLARRSTVASIWFPVSQFLSSFGQQDIFV
jgi:hypothetical protein